MRDRYLKNANSVKASMMIIVWLLQLGITTRHEARMFTKREIGVIRSVP